MSGVDMLTQLRARLGAASALGVAGVGRPKAAGGLAASGLASAGGAGAAAASRLSPRVPGDGSAKALASALGDGSARAQASALGSMASPRKPADSSAKAQGPAPGSSSVSPRKPGDISAKAKGSGSSVLGDLRSRLTSSTTKGALSSGTLSGRGSPAGGVAGFQDINEMLALRSIAKGGPSSLGVSLPISMMEKHAVVIDFGRRYTKVGIASEFRPRAVLRTPQLRRCRRLGSETFGTASLAEWADVLKPLLGEIFFHHLGVTAKDRRVVVCEHVDSPRPFREALAWLLFRHFLVASVGFVMGLCMPLYLTGLSTGIVLDVGYESTRILATGAGVPIVSAYTRAAAGGRHINALIRRGLQAAGLTGDWLDSEDVLEDIKAQACYVALDLKPTKTFAGMVLKSNAAAEFTSPECKGSPVTVPAACRWQPTEVFFTGLGDEPRAGAAASNGDDAPLGNAGNQPAAFDLDLTDEPTLEFPTVAAAFVETLLRCPIDSRRLVVQNVVICGGSAMLRGFLPRLAVDIQDAILHEPRTVKLAEHLRFTPLDFGPTWAVWVGGSIYGALEGSGDFTAEQYFKGQGLPDWVTDGYA